MVFNFIRQIWRLIKKEAGSSYMNTFVIFGKRWDFCIGKYLRNVDMIEVL